MRPYQTATAAFFVLIAAVAIFDSRAGALPDPTGAVPGGLRAGWYPFWAATIVALAGLIAAVRALTTAQPAEGAFRGPSQVVDLTKFIVPMALVGWLMSPGLLGFYVASGLYLTYYAGVVARYRWYYALASGIVIPVLIYLAFEFGFSALLPKSFLYPAVPF